MFLCFCLTKANRVDEDRASAFNVVLMPFFSLNQTTRESFGSQFCWKRCRKGYVNGMTVLRLFYFLFDMICWKKISNS